MSYLDNIDLYSTSDKIAHIYRNSSLSYKELKEQSDNIAVYFIKKFSNNKEPIMVYGHKEHLMLISFMACLKSGHPYIPVDNSMAKTRIKEIIDSAKPAAVINVSDGELHYSGNVENIYYIIENTKGLVPHKKYKTKENEPIYIIYTSGSTGKPKGVRINLSSLESFIKWASKLCNISDKEVFMNQAPFSFDLSVMDLYLSLTSGSTLFSIDKEMITNFKELFENFKISKMSRWISTPSFAEMCLCSNYFNKELLPKLKCALFCGEILTVDCAKKLKERFCDINIINLYGPTEATVAVTAVEITKSMLQYKILPVGIIKEDCKIVIVPESYRNTCEYENNIIKNLALINAVEGEKGEILIIGDSVAKDYYKDAVNTNKKFFTTYIDGKEKRGYKTGDEGYVKDGMLYYCGRIDFQIKLNGYRIELEDIENNLRCLNNVKNAVVIPVYKNEKISHLTALILLNKNETSITVMDIKRMLKNLIPDYMIPRKIIIKDSLPMNANGKINRKLLMEELSYDSL